MHGCQVGEASVLQRSVETGVQDLHNVRMATLGEYVDLLEQAVEALLLTEHVLHAHELNGYLLACRQLNR